MIYLCENHNCNVRLNLFLAEIFIKVLSVYKINLLKIDSPWELLEEGSGFTIREDMTTNDILGFDNFTEADTEKMEKIVKLINLMTSANWRDRPTAEEGLGGLANLALIYLLILQHKHLFKTF